MTCFRLPLKSAEVGSVQHQNAKMAELRRRVITQLSAAAKDQKSLALATLVMKMARDPFAKVKVRQRELGKIFENSVTRIAQN